MNFDVYDDMNVNYDMTSVTKHDNLYMCDLLIKTRLILGRSEFRN